MLLIAIGWSYWVLVMLICFGICWRAHFVTVFVGSKWQNWPTLPQTPYPAKPLPFAAYAVGALANSHDLNFKKWVSLRTIAHRMYIHPWFDGEYIFSLFGGERNVSETVIFISRMTSTSNFNTLMFVRLYLLLCTTTDCTRLTYF